MDQSSPEVRSLMNPYERVCQKLGVPVGTKTAKCPAHDDQKASLSIDEGDDGRAILCCHAGCTFDAITTKLGLTAKDLSAPKTSASQLEAVYPYRHANGELSYEILRYKPKRFSARRPNGHGGWIYNIDGVTPLLYRLPELLAADPKEPVLIPEGEKDVDRLRTRGFVATTNHGGARGWRHDLFDKYLAGRFVVLLEDNDRPGRRRVLEIAKGLAP
jgi:hypothetical protein